MIRLSWFLASKRFHCRPCPIYSLVINPRLLSNYKVTKSIDNMNPIDLISIANARKNFRSRHR